MWKLLLENVSEPSGAYCPLSAIPVSLADDVAMLEIT